MATMVAVEPRRHGPKPVNPAVDFVLGVALLSMLGCFAWHTVREWETNPQLAQLAQRQLFPQQALHRAVKTDWRILGPK